MALGNGKLMGINNGKWQCETGMAMGKAMEKRQVAIQVNKVSQTLGLRCCRVAMILNLSPSSLIGHSFRCEERTVGRTTADKPVTWLHQSSRRDKAW